MLLQNVELALRVVAVYAAAAGGRCVVTAADVITAAARPSLHPKFSYKPRLATAAVSHCCC